VCSTVFAAQVPRQRSEVTGRQGRRRRSFHGLTDARLAGLSSGEVIELFSSRKEAEGEPRRTKPPETVFATSHKPRSWAVCEADAPVSASVEREP
jgi:hypothetical protein